MKRSDLFKTIMRNLAKRTKSMDGDFSSVWYWLRVGGLWLQATIVGGFFLFILILAIFVRVRPAKLFGLCVGYFIFTFFTFIMLRLLIPEPTHNEIFTLALLIALPLIFIGNTLFEYGYRRTLGAAQL